MSLLARLGWSACTRRAAGRAPLRLALSCAVVFTWLTVPIIGQAQQPLTQDPYAQATALVAAGDLAGASAVLSRWAPRHPGDRERQLWALALIARQSGDLSVARSHLTALVAVRPDQPRFRSELAGVLEEMGEGDRAAQQAALAGTRISPRAALAAEPRLSTRLSFSIVPQSNPGQRTDAEVIEVLGLPLQIAPSARERAATGIRASARVAWSPRLGEASRVRLSLGVNGDLYEERAFNDLSASVEAAFIHVMQGGTRLEVGPGYHQRWLGGQLYSRGPGLTFGVKRGVGNRGILSTAVALQWLKHPAGPLADGRRAVAVLGYSHALSPQTALRASLRLERTSAAAAFLSLCAAELGLGVTHGFRGGLTLGADVILRRAQYDAGTGLFPQPREDDRSTLRLRVSHGKFTWNGFAPVIEVESARQRSTVPINSFKNVSVSVGFARSF